MKFLLAKILLFGLILGCQSAVYWLIQKEIPDFPGMCYDDNFNKLYSANEQMVTEGKDCMRKICRGSIGQGKVLVQIETCLLVSSTKCFVASDVNKMYPECCKKVCNESVLKETILDEIF